MKEIIGILIITCFLFLGCQETAIAKLERMECPVMLHSKDMPKYSESGKLLSYGSIILLDSEGSMVEISGYENVAKSIMSSYEVKDIIKPCL